MLNIAICDDDIQITGKIERLLQDIAKRNFVDTEYRSILEWKEFSRCYRSR